MQAVPTRPARNSNREGPFFTHGDFVANPPNFHIRRRLKPDFRSTRKKLEIWKKYGSATGTENLERVLSQKTI